MNTAIIEKIESNEDFKILIEEVIQKTKLDIRKNIFDSSVLNNDSKQLISYYQNERQKILKKFKKDSYSLRVEFDKDDIIINTEDYEQLFIHPNCIYDYLDQIKWNKEYHTEKRIKEKKKLFQFHKLRLKDVKNNIWLSYFNLTIEQLTSIELNKKQKTEPYFHSIFENINSELFFEYLIKEWFNNIRKPKSAISFVFHLMSTNDNYLESEYRGIKYIFKDIIQYDFAVYWNKNYKEIHIHKYEIKIDFKTARLKSFNEIPSETYINKLKECVIKFENIN
jgi:hypothetical protein